MTRIESNKEVVNATPAEVWDYLSDMNNLYHLLPQDKISDWDADEKQCSFKVQGSYTIGLQMEAGSKPDKINMTSSPESPFPFKLFTTLGSKDSQTEASLLCEAELNPFLKMLVEKPLRNLFNHIAEKLRLHYS